MWKFKGSDGDETALVNSSRIIQRRKMEGKRDVDGAPLLGDLRSGPDKRIMARRGESAELTQPVLLAAALHYRPRSAR